MSENEENERKDAPEQPNAPFQDAHEAFFQDLNKAWNDLQRRAFDLNVEYQRAFMQPPEVLAASLQDTQTKYQQGVQSLCDANEPTSSVCDAYKRYKDAVQKAIANINLDTLDPMTMAAIGQSMTTVAWIAGQVGWQNQTNRQADHWG